MTRLLQTRRVCAVAVAAVGMALSAAPARAQVSNIAVEPDGSIVAIDFIQDTVLRVDPATGAVTTVSSATVGSGPSLADSWGVAVDGDGSLLVTAGFSAQSAVLRVDPVSGDRTTVSSQATGGGPPFLAFQRDIALGSDGSLFVSEDPSHAPDQILRIDPATGDRSIVSDSTVGAGPPLLGSTGIAVEATGTLAWAGGFGVFNGPEAVMRVDPATGNRTVVSDATTGTGRPFGWLQAVAVEADATILVLDRYRDVFCVAICPSPFCVLCLTNGPTVHRVDPVNGDRNVVSGGGTCLTGGTGDCGTPYFGRRGPGPDFDIPLGIVAEAAQSVLVADWHRVVRVNARTGRREVLATVSGSSGAALRQRNDRLRRPGALDDRRVYRPADASAWLRRALGDASTGVNLRRPERLWSGLSPDRARVVGERLYAALWKTMRDLLGADHPDTLATAPAPRAERD